MKFTDEQYDRLIEAAEMLGTQDGKEKNYPCDLSGEWADRPTAKDVLISIYAIALQTDDSLDADDFYMLEDVDTDYILDFYESAYNNEYWYNHQEEPDFFDGRVEYPFVNPLGNPVKPYYYWD